MGWKQFSVRVGSELESERQDLRAGEQAGIYLSSGSGSRTRIRPKATERLEKIDEAKLLKTLEDSDRVAGLNRCGRLLKEELERTKNYHSVGKFLADLPNADVKRLLNEWILGTSTGLGVVRDYDEQKWLIEDLGLSDDLRLTDRLYYLAGGIAFPELVLNRSRDLLEARALEMSLKGSANHHGVKETIEALPGLFIDNHAVPSVQRGVEWLLAAHSTESSAAIGNLPPGYPKDVMIEAMAVWLAKKGEARTIEAWIDLVSDPSVKARVQATISR